MTPGVERKLARLAVPVPFRCRIGCCDVGGRSKDWIGGKVGRGCPRLAEYGLNRDSLGEATRERDPDRSSRGEAESFPLRAASFCHVKSCCEELARPCIRPMKAASSDE